VARKDRLVWNGDEAMEQINREMVRRLFAAAITVEKHAKVLVGKEGTGRRVKTGRKLYAGVRKRREARDLAKKLNRRQRRINRVIGVGNKLKKRINRASSKAAKFGNKLRKGAPRKLKKRIKRFQGAKLKSTAKRTGRFKALKSGKVVMKRRKPKKG
jgi:hypothetical protein